MVLMPPFEQNANRRGRPLWVVVFDAARGRTADAGSRRREPLAGAFDSLGLDGEDLDLDYLPCSLLALTNYESLANQTSFSR